MNNSSEVNAAGEILQSLLVEGEEHASPQLTPRSAMTTRSRSYSTDITFANGRSVVESTVSIQKLPISTAGVQFNNTNAVIGDAATVSFKTTTTTTTTYSSIDVNDNGEAVFRGDDIDVVTPRDNSQAASVPIATTQETRVEITIGPQHFDLLKLLGTGAFGKVVLVQNRLSKELYAMKVISKKLLRKKNNVQYMKSERQILTKIHHPFLVSLKFAFQSETKLFLVMDFLSGGELFLHLRRRGLILEHEVQFYLGEMVLAMDFLHHHGIIHRDLKPENILLRGDGHICITDFGLAKEIGDGQAARTLCGTSEYMAPEMLTRTGYGKAVDWWALGALCYEMMVGKPPFLANNQKDLDRKIMFEKISVPSYLTANAVSLLRGMLEKDPTKRLGCAKGSMFNLGGVAALKQHAFFDGLDWVGLDRLELTPPIDLSQVKPPNNGSSNAAGNKTTPLPNVPAAAKKGGMDDDDEDVVLPPEADTRFFSEEFTTQVLSPSLLEDTFSTHEQTPVKNRSRANSFLSGQKSKGSDESDDFEDFEYMSGSFKCTAEQLEEYEEMMKLRQVKEAKKRAFRLKKEAKQAEEELLRKQKAEKEALEKKRLEQEKKDAKEKQKLENERRQRLNEKRRAYEEQERARSAHNVRVNVFLEEMNQLAKKLKNVRKKIRDIVDLKERLAKDKKALDKDQQQKVSRLPELEDELNDLLAEETTLQARNPGDLLPPIVPDAELAAELHITLPTPAAVTSSTTSSSSSSTTPAPSQNNATSSTSTANAATKPSASSSPSNPPSSTAAPAAAKKQPSAASWVTVASNKKKK